MLDGSNQQDPHCHWGFAGRSGCLRVETSGLMLCACLRLLEPATVDADLVSVWPAATAGAACVLVTTPLATGGVPRRPFCSCLAAGGGASGRSYS